MEGTLGLLHMQKEDSTVHWGCLLHLASDLLTDTQKLVVAGFTEGEHKDKAFYSTCDRTKVHEPSLNNNSEEADTRLWLHCVKSKGAKKLIYSPDTDTLFIGMVAANTIVHNVVIQQTLDATDRKFLHLNSLVEAINKDVDLNCIPAEERTRVLQSLYALTGCDFTSYFVGFGNVTFFKTFYWYASFISGEANKLTSFAHLGTYDGFLAFLRLIGTVQHYWNTIPHCHILTHSPWPPV